MILIEQLHSAQPLNSKKFQFILFINAISSARIAPLSFFDRILIHHGHGPSPNIDFFTASPSASRSKVRGDARAL
jgi:hypothetical protein